MALITVPTASNTHASDMCKISDSLASVTTNTEIQNSSVGVSLKNALFSSGAQIPTPTIEEILTDDFQEPEDYHWYFLRVNYGRAEKFYNELKDKKDGFLLWMPCQKVITYKDCKKTEILHPIFSSNLFIYSTYDQAFALTHRAAEKGYSFVDFAYDHTSQNEYGRDNVITIRFKEMLQFIRAEHIHHPWAHLVKDEEVHFRPGGMVKVIDGSFKGVEGRVARVFGQTRVVVSIKGILNYATAYISSKNLKPIEESEANEDAPKKLEAGNSIEQRIRRHQIKIGKLMAEDKNPRHK